MKVVLGKFASWGLKARFGTDLAAGVQAALLHYTRRLKSMSPPVGIPRLSRDQPDPGVNVAFELAIAPDVQATLEVEARRYPVPVERVLVHAVLVYLADLDSIADGEPDRGSSPLRSAGR